MLIIVVLCYTLIATTYCDDSQPSTRLNLFPFPSLMGDEPKIAEDTNQLTRGEEEDDDDDVIYLDENTNNVRDKKNVKMWDHWGKWSPCSVSCGVGKMTRWRHCISEGCSPGEKEAQIKTCTMSPCH